MTDDTDPEPDDDLGRWSVDELDGLLRDTVGRIPDDAFDALIAEAITLRQPAPGELSPTSLDVTPIPLAPRARLHPRRVPVQWLAAAAFVAIIGAVLAVSVRSGMTPANDPGTAAQGPPATSADDTRPPASTSATVEQDGPCDQVSGGDPIAEPDPTRPAMSSRVFRCTIAVSAPGTADEPGSTILVDDASLAANVVPATSGGALACLDFRSGAAELWIGGARCDGGGLRAAAEQRGVYRIDFRAQSCTALPEGLRCGAPETDFVGQIFVEVT